MKQLKLLNKWIINFWQTVKFLIPVLTLLATAALLIISNEQVHDFLRDQLSHQWYWNKLAVFVWTMIWDFITFICCRFLLDVHRLTLLGARHIRKKWIMQIPRITGIVPSLFLGIAFCNISGDNAILFGIIYFLQAVLVYVFFAYRRSLLNMPEKFSAAPISVHLRFPKLNRKSSVGYLSFLAGIVYITLVMLPPSTRFNISMSPSIITISGFCFLTLLVTLIGAFNERKRPLFLIIAIWFVFSGIWNDNSLIRKSNKKTVKKDSIPEHFIKWYCFKTQNKTSGTIPVFFIAHEGGGSRALNWSAMMLNALGAAHSDFINNTFMMSGVSGGGVGMCFYTAYLRDSLAHYYPDNKNNFSCLDAVMKEDYLSDLLAGFFFSDNLQKFIPYPIPYLNRSNRLEDAWSCSYSKHLAQGTFDSSFMDIWERDSSLQYKIPSLFINSTMAETGQKAICSNLLLTENCFRDVLDISSYHADDLRFKSAMSICARFPYICSGALLTDSNKKLGHLVDGGYLENTGIETCVQTLNALSSTIDSINNSNGSVKVRPVILFVKNSTCSQELKALTMLHDLKTPVNAFINTWDRGGIRVFNLAQKTLERNTAKSKCEQILVMEVALDRTKAGKKIPLGWYLSESSLELIEKSVTEETKKINIDTLFR